MTDALPDGALGPSPPRPAVVPAVTALSPPDRLAVAGRRRGPLLRLIQSEHFILVLCVIYAGAAYPFVPVLFTPEVAGNILADMMPLLIVAVGQTFVMVVAGIDLSVTAVIALAAVVGASVMTADGGYIPGPAGIGPALAAMLGVGLGVGALNGLSVTRLNMPPFLVTLATRMFFSGFAIWYTTLHTASSSIAGLPAGFTTIAGGAVLSFDLGGSAFRLPLIPVAIAALVTAAAHLALSRSILGRWLLAVGANCEAARISGVPVERAIVIAFVISGLCGAIAGILMSSRLETGSPILGETMLLDVIGAVVIGGTSLFGGKGKIVWTVSGVLFLTLLDTTMKLLGASLFVIYVIKGGVILAAAILDTLRNRLFAERPA